MPMLVSHVSRPPCTVGNGIVIDLGVLCATSIVAGTAGHSDSVNLPGNCERRRLLARYHVAMRSPLLLRLPMEHGPTANRLWAAP